MRNELGRGVTWVYFDRGVTGRYTSRAIDLGNHETTCDIVKARPVWHI